ncbi:hypothetical protein F4802DRAFT_603595 [Xylaria palmicola]|nr:hypothetical protein F4802DRAFT_603595 [Xylaria palmicola]
MASDKITAKDMMAVNWEKLAAKAGFEDAATARAHYEPLLDPRCPNSTCAAAGQKQRSHDNKAASMQVKTETLEAVDGDDRYARNHFTSHYLSDLKDGEA